MPAVDAPWFLVAQGRGRQGASPLIGGPALRPDSRGAGPPTYASQLARGSLCVNPKPQRGATMADQWVAYKKATGMLMPETQVRRGTYAECVAALVRECSEQRDRAAIWGGPQNTRTLDAVRDLARGLPRKSQLRGYGYLWGMRPA